jgi:hypothetical protein
MTYQSQVWLNLIVLRSSRVFEIIEDVYIPTHCLCGDYFLVLGHISRFVYFALVINLDVD